MSTDDRETGDNELAIALTPTQLGVAAVIVAVVVIIWLRARRSGLTTRRDHG